MREIEIIKPDDWHLHLREGQMLSTVLPYSENVFSRALIMPNLKPPVKNRALAEKYFSEIKKISKTNFQPKMAIYLTAETTADEIINCANNPEIIAIKWYPVGATTNSEFGVSAQMVLENPQMYEVLSTISQKKLVLSIHGEVVEKEVDIFAREREFLSSVLLKIIKKFPNLKICLEHISSKDAVDFINTYSITHPIAATITAHHLNFNRNAMLSGGIRPHFYCLPILKKESDRQSLLSAAISGSSAFFLGTDSAPHTQGAKEATCGCAGCWSAPVAMSLYSQVFAEQNKLELLENFSSKFGADFYGLKYNSDKILIQEKTWQVPAKIGEGANTIIPFLAGEVLAWQVAR